MAEDKDNSCSRVAKLEKMLHDLKKDPLFDFVSKKIEEEPLVSEEPIVEEETEDEEPKYKKPKYEKPTKREEYVPRKRKDSYEDNYHN